MRQWPHSTRRTCQACRHVCCGTRSAPLEAYLAAGRPQDILELTDEVVDLTESIEEIYYWRARALLATGDGAGAREAVQHALSLAPDFAPAVQWLSELDSA